MRSPVSAFSEQNQPDRMYGKSDPAHREVMVKFRNVLTALAVTSVSALATAAPASAQTPTPPCLPGTPVIDNVDCAFALARWAEDEIAKQPEAVIDEGQEQWAAVVAQINATALFVTETQDAIEQMLVDEVCVQFGVDDCPWA